MLYFARTWLPTVLILFAGGAALAAPGTKSPVAAQSIANEGFLLRFPTAPPVPQMTRPAPARPTATLNTTSLEELPAPPPAAAPPSSNDFRPALPTPPALMPAYVPTHHEFAASFRPVPGYYEVVLLHPYTRRPVKVCFTLPPGRLKKVNVDRNELEFDYGEFEVEIFFKRRGDVKVDLED